MNTKISRRNLIRTTCASGGLGILAAAGTRNQALAQQNLASAQIDEGESLMALYELRTYTLYVDKMAEATKLRP